MRRTFIAILFLSFGLSLLAQNTKGVSLESSSNQQNEGTTYALIIGISKYKNPEIPSLQFADRDAIAFHNYLVASGVDSNNITLLLNENASYAETMLSLHELCTEKVKAGDKVFIYFSGHGDVESQVITNVGYLLPYDAPKVVYAISAINVRTLQDYVSTLSANEVQAIVITDACHSGNLAGGLEGMRNIQTLLGDRWQDEIKILSCQPGELSLEGEQWGSGRGLFSYELINGMAGMADRNDDGMVSLRELNLYLLEKVPDEAHPLPQNPVLIGNAEASISKNNPRLLASLTLQENDGSLEAINTQSFDEALLRGLHDTIKFNYSSFQQHLENGENLSTSGAPSAYYYYVRIPESDSTKLLKKLMKKNLSVEFMKDISVAIAKSQNTKWNTNILTLAYKGTLLREMLGDEKLRLLNFLSKAIFWEAATTFLHNSGYDLELALRKLDTCIALEPNGAYIYVSRGNIYRRLGKFELSIAEEIKAVKLSPQYLFSYLIIGGTYRDMEQYDSSIVFFRKALAIDSTFDLAYFGMTRTYQMSGEKDSADFYSKKWLTVSTLNAQAQDSIEQAWSWFDIGLNCHFLKKYSTAIDYYKKAIEVNFEYSPVAYYNIACSYSLTNNKTTSLKHLEESLKNGFNNSELIKLDPDLDNIRSTPEFKALIKKYFPEEYKE